jgi:(1->4)-alpha-D-glucan 1-alpha-D-glucosylmutase
MGLLLDIVPNHMGVSEHNKLWMDVLEHGRSSAYAPFFDIEWNSSFCPVSFTLYFCC